MPIDRTADLAIALTLADHADAVSMRRWRGPLTTWTKRDHSIVTDADVTLDDELRCLLAETRPHDRVVTEEACAAGPAEAVRTWVIDPIDGTTNFADGCPEFGTLISLVDAADGLRLGVVSLPARGLRWWGVIGECAYQARAAEPAEQARPAAPRRLKDCRLVYRMPGSWERRRYSEPLGQLLEMAGKSRVCRDASGPCEVAAGTADLSLTCGGAIWDLAAPMSVVLAAGACAADFTGAADPGRHTLITASHPELLRDVLAVLGGPR